MRHIQISNKSRSPLTETLFFSVAVALAICASAASYGYLQIRKELDGIKAQLNTVEERLAICARALLAEPKTKAESRNTKTHNLLTRGAR
jgi:hypothetical protein